MSSHVAQPHCPELSPKLFGSKPDALRLSQRRQGPFQKRCKVKKFFSVPQSVDLYLEEDFFGVAGRAG